MRTVRLTLDHLLIRINFDSGKKNELILKKLGLHSFKENSADLQKYSHFKLQTKLSVISDTMLEELQFRNQFQTLRNRQHQIQLDIDNCRLEKQKEEVQRRIEDLSK